MTRRARILVSGELLAKALNLPYGTQMLTAHVHSTFDADTFEFCVAHDSLPEVPDGAPTPLVNVIYQVTACRFEPMK